MPFKCQQIQERDGDGNLGEKSLVQTLSSRNRIDVNNEFQLAVSTIRLERYYNQQ